MGKSRQVSSYNNTIDLKDFEDRNASEAAMGAINNYCLMTVAQRKTMMVKEPPSPNLIDSKLSIAEELIPLETQSSLARSQNRNHLNSHNVMQ